MHRLLAQQHTQVRTRAPRRAHAWPCRGQAWPCRGRGPRSYCSPSSRVAALVHRTPCLAPSLRPSASAPLHARPAFCSCLALSYANGIKIIILFFFFQLFLAAGKINFFFHFLQHSNKFIKIYFIHFLKFFTRKP